jgi:hypothetical protein
VISLAPGTKVYLASKPVSMRLGFDGLAALVRPLFAVEPYAGHVFLFRSRSGSYLKALHAGAVRAAHRGDGLAPHRGPSGTKTAGADVGVKTAEKRGLRLGASRPSGTQNHVAGWDRHTGKP